MGFSPVSNPLTKLIEQTPSLGAGCQDPFLSNASCLLAIIHAYLSCLHLVELGKIFK